LTGDFQTEYIGSEFTAICIERNNKLKVELNKILEYKPNELFYFQEGSAINYYLVANLYKNGTNISLVQDGLKAYSIVTKRFEFLTLARDTYLAYKNLFEKKIPIWRMHWFWNYKYGISKEISELWVSHPDAFIKNNKKRIRKIPDITDADVYETVKKVFRFEQSIYLNRGNENAIFYINQPFYDNYNIEIEHTFLKELIDNIKSVKVVYIKIHRSTTEYHFNFYKSLPGVVIINETIPAELLVLSLKNSIILSGWSTTLLTYNNTCNYYYNYPIYRKDMLLSQSYPFNPTNYIEVIDDVNKISLP
jgi:hypothetical protein